MHKAVQDLLKDHDSRQASWHEWQHGLLHAARQAEVRKNEFYRLRLIAVISAITVPSLVGLNLSATGGVLVRWITFALSLVAAISTAFLTLYRLGDRWLMYRKLRDDLLKVGWDLVNCPRTDPQEEWDAFVTGTGAAIDQYNATYGKVIIGAAQSAQNEKTE
jgi:hypothetical protein